MSMIPNDVLETILLGLSAFDLFRCKAVCNAWRRIISSADFVAAHLEQTKSDPSSHHLLVRNRGSIDVRRPVAGGPFLSFACFSSSDLLIVGSANGLICIAGTGERIPTPEDIWILNPVTGLSKKLPYSRFPSASKNGKFAFWCDDDGVYKVAKFMSNSGVETTLELWVSTSPCSWTDICTIELEFHLHPRRCHPCDVLLQGLAAYWIIIADDFGDDYITVVSLDLNTLTVTKFMPLSEEGLLFMWDLNFFRAVNGYPNSVVFGGSLNGEFVLVAYASYERVYSVWTLVTKGMDDNEEACWMEKFRICFDFFPFEKCLGIVNDKLVLTCYDDMQVALCDPMTRKLEVIETGSKLETVTLDAACGFVGSLVSMDGFGFEWNYLLRKYMGIKWPYSSYPYPIKLPYSSYPYTRKESSITNLKKRRRRTRWDQTPVNISVDARCGINHLATSIIALSQEIPFFHAGDEILRSKSLDRDSYNSSDWFNRIKTRLDNPAFKPDGSHILAALESFCSFISIRYSSPLFRLHTSNDVQERVQSHNSGPSWVPGVIVMGIEDGHEGFPGLPQLDPIFINIRTFVQIFDLMSNCEVLISFRPSSYSYIVVIVNVCPNDITFTSPSLKEKGVRLHSIQMNSTDDIVKNSAYDSSYGSFRIPARTTSVFVEPRLA